MLMSMELSQHFQTQSTGSVSKRVRKSEVCSIERVRLTRDRIGRTRVSEVLQRSGRDDGNDKRTKMHLDKSRFN